MTNSLERAFKLPPQQQAIRDKCFHRSGTFVEFPIDDVETSIPARFEKIVRAFKDQTAVETADWIVTYAELNAMANRAARAILDVSGRGGDPIALLFENGPYQMAAMLGVLKTGNFFVLLDPLLPRTRIDGILDNIGASLIVTDQNNFLLANELIGPQGRVISFENVRNNLSGANPALPISPKAIAYVSYTAGSTGQPKGVIRDHRAHLHNTMLYANAYHVQARDRLSLLASATARAIHDTFVALLNGSAIVPFNVRRGGVSRLPQWLREKRISIWSVSAPVFRNVCRGLQGKVDLPDLRLIRLGSEAAYRDDFELFKKYFPNSCVLANGLTSNESGMLTMFRMDADVKLDDTALPVGYSAQDKEILLLDDTGTKVGIGEVGEIVVRSRYLSPGYWRRPELTETKFKPHPSGGDERLYFTGDLGLMLPDGCLVHKGRKDFRLKIRGYGVDLVEVQNTLRQHSGIKEAVVVGRQNDTGETLLIAYFTSSNQQGPTTSELRQFMGKTLSDYMIPSVFMRLDALPLTPNGKVDRNALPEPDKLRPELSVSYVAPRTTIEQRLAQMWAELLGVERVGVHDNFFDLGGHSLAGARLVSLIHEEFKFDLPVSEFFAEPTIGQLAQRIDPGREVKLRVGMKPWSYLCELQRGKDRKPVFVFPGGGGGEPEFFVYGFLARQVGTEYPFYGLRARGADGVSQPHTSVSQMVDAYVEEIRAMQPEGPYFLIGECAGGVTAYEAARQLVAQGQHVAMLVLMDVERPRLTKYLHYCTASCGRWWNKTIRRRWQENRYFARIPLHMSHLRLLRLSKYPRYLLGGNHTTPLPAEPKLDSGDSRHERAATVLRAGASGQALKHIEWVRQSYRHTVRRFRPEPYRGHVEIIVSEELYRQDPTLGWEKLALKGLSIHPVPGDHLSYIRDNARVAGLKLRECLERAEKQGTLQSARN